MPSLAAIDNLATALFAGGDQAVFEKTLASLPAQMALDRRGGAEAAEHEADGTCGLTDQWRRQKPDNSRVGEIPINNRTFSKKSLSFTTRKRYLSFASKKESRMYRVLTIITGGAIALASGGAAMAAPLLNGSGFFNPPAIVTYDPAAPQSNFGSPGTTTSGASYNIYTGSDATYAYVLVQETGAGTAPGSFANLYFGTGSSASSTSDVAFEVTNSDVFVPGGSGTTQTAGTGIAYASLDNGSAIEFAVPFTYFETDPQDIGFTPTTAADPDIILRLSQSFGYSVAGGTSYGTSRLGLIVDPIGSTAVPEPASLALLGLGLVGLIGLRRSSV